MVQNIHKQTDNSTESFILDLTQVSSSLATVLLLDAIYHKITNKYYYQTFSAIIYYHPKLNKVASVASEVLEKA